MQLTEIAILLVNLPAATVKGNVELVFSVTTVVLGIFLYYCLPNANTHWYLKEMRPITPTFFITALYMFNKYFSWVEHLTELTLHTLSMLKYTLVYL